MTTNHTSQLCISRLLHLPVTKWRCGKWNDFL